jgi:hypothetical protein
MNVSGAASAAWHGGLAGPVREVGAGGQGVGVLCAEHPLADGQQRGELAAGGSRVPGLPGPVREDSAGDEGVRVLGAEIVLAAGEDLPVQVSGGAGITGVPQVAGGPVGCLARVGDGGQDVGKRRGEGRPCGGLLRGPGGSAAVIRAAATGPFASGSRVGRRAATRRVAPPSAT